MTSFEELARTARALRFDDWPGQSTVSARAESLIAATLGGDSHFVQKIREVSFAPMFAPAPDGLLQSTWRDGCETLAGLLEAAAEAASMKKPSIAEPHARLEALLERFHQTALLLKERPQKRPPLLMDDEYDVQYLLGALLTVEFGDVREEEYTPSYAGGNARIDFLLAEHGIAVEVKRTRDTLRSREIGQELLVDIKRYAAHPSVRALVCFVYDPDGFIKNVRGLVGDLEKCSSDALSVRALVAPVR